MYVVRSFDDFPGLYPELVIVIPSPNTDTEQLKSRLEDAGAVCVDDKALVFVKDTMPGIPPSDIKSRFYKWLRWKILSER